MASPGRTPQPHAPSVYAATAPDAHPRPPLAGSRAVDVVIIGAGFTGLSAALHLAEAGRSVAVVEANRIGWGATGRNGGQLHSGQRQDIATLEAWYGRDQSRLLMGLAEEAKATVKSLIDRHGIACGWRDGLIHAMHKARFMPDLEREVEVLARDYGITDIRLMNRDEVAAATGTSCYFGATRDASAGHLHPLNYALGLARAAERAGAEIFEGTLTTRLTPDGIETKNGRIAAREVIVACNAYLDGLEPVTDAHIMPLNNFVLATEPLGDRLARLIPGGEAIADSRFVIYYWRPDADGRLIFGGGENYSPRFPADIGAFVRRHMLTIYPGLADARVDYAWGGALAVTVKRMPFLRRIRPGLYSAAGYSGHGIAIATLAGKLMAEAVRGETERFDIMARIPAMKFPGGRLLRHPSMVLGMLWYALRDRF